MSVETFERCRAIQVSFTRPKRTKGSRQPLPKTSPMFPADLPEVWLKLAEQQEKLGAGAQASTLRFCAEQLLGGIERQEETHLTLHEAADLSGYSTDHLGRLVREGKIPNAGRPKAPRIARKDLPRKTGPVAGPIEIGEIDRTQIVRSAINEGVG